MLRTALGRVRLVGIIEGLSFLVLLLIAMPLKYWADIPEAVMIVGSLHGALFVLYLLAILNVWIVDRWRFGLVVLAGAASFVPGGPFLLDRKLKRMQP
jgi:integral membrane protein